jgi:FkbM family methyltransferase
MITTVRRVGSMWWRAARARPWPAAHPTGFAPALRVSNMMRLMSPRLPYTPHSGRIRPFFAAGPTFVRNYGRGAALRDLLNFSIGEFLYRKGKKHLVDGRRQLVVFSFDYIAQTIDIEGGYELRELETLFDWLAACGVETRNGAAIDVGANVGNHSLYFSDFFESVYAIEPNPRTYKVLCLNAELADNVHCIQVGASDVERTAVLHIEPNNIGGSFVAHSAAATSAPSSQVVELKTLDSLFTDAPNIKLIKLDIEGHEREALLGAREIIAKQQPIVLFEQHTEDFVDGQSAIVELLKQFGYARFATLERYPRSAQGGGLLVKGVRAVMQTLFGASLRLDFPEVIRPGFYPFIIAVPEWL